MSHETIYRSLFIQARGALKKELLEQLRRSSAMPRSRHTPRKPIITVASVTPFPIASVRPTLRVAQCRGTGKVTCYVAAKTADCHAGRALKPLRDAGDGAWKRHLVVGALIENARRLPQELYRSLTWDRGKEMVAHKRFTLETDLQVYFCDP